MTPWPWIALGVYVTYSVCTRILAAHRSQRARQVVLEVCSAQLDLDEPRLRRKVANLAAYTGSSFEAALLLAAHQSMEGRYDVAIETLQRLTVAIGEVGKTSPLVLQFPGIPVPLPLTALTEPQEASRLLRDHLFALSGSASEVVRTAKPPASPELLPISTWVLAEAHGALQSHDLAASTLRQALDARPEPPTEWALAYRRVLAREYELGGFMEHAAHEWRILAGEGDVVAREKLAEREREERRRAAVAEEQRRMAAEAQAQREAERRDAERRAAEERARAEAAQRELAAAARASAKVKAAKTSAGRRSALQSGLAELSSPELRQQLLLEAARVEVQAVLAKAATLKTTKTKRRHLEDALSALRADDIPDELQAQEIALLEQALADLTGFGTLDSL